MIAPGSGTIGEGGAPGGQASTSPSRWRGPKGPSRMGPARRTVREIGLALITVGVIILLFVTYQLVGTNLTEERNQSHLAKQFAAAVAAAGHPRGITAPRPTSTQTSSPQPGSTQPTTTPASTATSTPVTDPLPSLPVSGAIEHLVIPRIGVDKFVVQGTSEDDLRQGPGHYLGTPYPGQIGNVGIAGHRTTYGAPFFDLNELTTGDDILVTDLQDRTWKYQVSEPPQVVSPDDVSVLDPTTIAQLTLTTCNPRFSATSRLVVFARLVGRALPATPPPPATPKVIPLAGTHSLGTGENSAWPPALAYGILVLAAWVATRIWIHRTRGRWRLVAYVVGIGACLVALWFVFENAILLLPQSI